MLFVAKFEATVLQLGLAKMVNTIINLQQPSKWRK